MASKSTEEAPIGTAEAPMQQIPGDKNDTGQQMYPLHAEIYNAKSSIEKISIGFLVATIAIGVYTTPEVHKLACSVAKNVELIFENSLGLIADQDGLLDL
jgi:hypothetical protein